MMRRMQCVAVAAVSMLVAVLAIQLQENAILLALAVTVAVGLLKHPAVLVGLIPYGVFIWNKLADVGGFNVTCLDALLALMYLYVLKNASFCWLRMQADACWRMAGLLLLLSWIPVLLSMIGAMVTLGAQDAIKSILFVKRWSAYSIMPLACMIMANSNSAKWIRHGFIVANLIFFASIVFNFSPLDLVAGNVADTGTPLENRATGLFFNPNVAGNASVLMLNMYLGRFLRSKRTQTNVALVLLMVANLAILASSGSREALVGLMAAGFFWLFFAKGALRKYMMLLLPLLVAFIAIVFLTPMGEVMLQRAGQAVSNGSQETNVNTRIESQMIGWQIAKQYPLGVGVGNIGLVSKDETFRSNASFIYESADGITTTDNQVIDTLVEMGVLGLICFAASIICMYKTAGMLNAVEVKVNIITMAVVGLAAQTFFSAVISSLLWSMLASFFAIKRSEER